MATPSEAFMESILAGPDGTDETPIAEVETPVVVEPSLATEPPAIASTPPITVPQSPRVASFDDLTPDLPDLPPTRRGAPLRLLVDDRKAAIQQAIDAGNEKNAFRARAEVAERALEILTRRLEPQPVAPPVVEPPPPETSIDALRRRTDPNSFQFDPEGVLSAAVDTAEERSRTEALQKINELRTELETKIAEVTGRTAVIEQKEATQRTIGAYRTAFPDRSPATDPSLDLIGFYIDSVNKAATDAGQPPPLPVDDPQSYLKADAWISSVAALRAPPPAPAAVVQPSSPAIVAPQAALSPAPPVGSGEPAAAAPLASIEALPQHDRAAIEEMFTMFPQLRGKKDLADEIIGGVAADAAAGKSPYSRKNVRRSASA